MAFTVDRAASKRKLNQLERYFNQQIWNPDDGFICSSKEMCRTSAMRKPDTAFYGGQGQMVGPSFDLAENGIPLRVLVIPMEYGTARRGVSVAKRSEHVVRTGDKAFNKLNPHMRGVLFALQLAYGLHVGEMGDTHLPLVGKAPVHLFEAFAMVNLLWCSAVKKGTMSSRSTGMMRASCARHMRATIDILKPTLVMSQGVGLDETLRASLGVREPINAHLATCDLDGNQFVWASLKHPTLSWHSTKYAYFKEVVKPTITQARAVAMERADCQSVSPADRGVGT